MTTAAARPALGGRRRWFSLALVLLSALAVGATLGMTAPLVTFWLQRAGHDSLTIGLVAAAYSGAILLTGPFVPWLIRRLGPIPALLLGLAIVGGPLVAFPFVDGLPAWLALRLVMGAGTMIGWVASEIWINSIATDATRGRVVGLYATVWAGGIALGPFLLSLVGTKGSLPFFVSAGILCLAVLPLSLARGLVPAMAEGRSAHDLTTTWRAAPVAMAAGVLCGLSETAVFALFPLYGLATGHDEASAVLMLSAFAGGSIALQTLMGWAIDHIGRRPMLLATASLAALAVTLLPFVGDGLALWPLLFLWGGAVAGFYTIGLVLLGDRFGGADLAHANTSFIMAYTVGMVIGPFLGGGAMALWQPHGLVAVLAVASALYLAVVMARR